MFLDSPPPEKERLTLKDQFRFSCHDGLSCFNRCCRNKHLPLTPYDVLRIKNHLGLHSDHFLSQYAVYRLDADTGFPILSIRMQGEDGVCPFVTPDGCSIYENRPTACRLYPLGRSARPGASMDETEAFYSLLPAPNCQGLNEEKSWTVSRWVENQGLLPFNQMNDQMLRIFFHSGRNRQKILDNSQQQKVMVACYNLDLFREFVFETPFLKQFDIKQETADRVRTDDTALLQLGFSYLKKALYN